MIFGKSSGFVDIDLASLSMPVGFKILGEAEDDQSGTVSVAGDINNDGYGDIIIGAYRASPNGIYRAGASYVIFGKSSGFIDIDLAALTMPVGIKISGAAGNDLSGYSVSYVGDVNNDGYGDIIIGAYGASPSGRDGAGTSYVIFGNYSYRSTTQPSTEPSSTSPSSSLPSSSSPTTIPSSTEPSNSEPSSACPSSNVPSSSSPTSDPSSIRPSSSVPSSAFPSSSNDAGSYQYQPSSILYYVSPSFLSLGFIFGLYIFNGRQKFKEELMLLSMMDTMISFSMCFLSLSSILLSTLSSFDENVIYIGYCFIINIVVAATTTLLFITWWIEIKKTAGLAPYMVFKLLL